MPNLLVYIMLFGWIPIVLGLFAVLKPHRAVIVAYIFAWLFLPQYTVRMDGVPDYNKMTAAFFGVMIGLMIFDLNKLLTFKPRWFDVPMLFFCICPIFSSITNGLGFYDGVTAAFGILVRWGGPYLIGRLYFNNLVAMRDFVLAVVIGGLVYVPLCLFEIRMSPQLHTTFYGFFQHDFSQMIRGGGFRPIVFMSHALTLNAWMVGSFSCGFVMWWLAKKRELFGVPTAILLGALLLVILLSKTYIGFVLLAMVVGVIYVSQKTRSPLPAISVVVVCFLFLGTRLISPWTGDQLVSAVGVINQDRADSIAFRFRNENRLLLKANQKPVFGWGGWGRSRDVSGLSSDTSKTVTDSLWIIILGQKGYVGLLAYMAAASLPVLLFARRFPGRFWVHPALAPPIAMAMLCLISLVCNIPNGLANPVFTLALGGLSSLMPGSVNLGGQSRESGLKRYVKPARRGSRLTREASSASAQSNEV